MRDLGCSDVDNVKDGLKENQLTESGDCSVYESGMCSDKTRWRHREEKQ